MGPLQVASCDFLKSWQSRSQTTAVASSFPQSISTEATRPLTTRPEKSLNITYTELCWSKQSKAIPDPTGRERNSTA